jgi:hypothetical protein
VVMRWSLLFGHGVYGFPAVLLATLLRASLSFLVKRAEDRHVIEIAEKLCGHVLSGHSDMRYACAFPGKVHPLCPPPPHPTPTPSP